MGSEDLFHRRKARDGAALQRQKRERARNKRYLIVCEGTRTEPQYLRELRDDLSIRPQVVRIAPNDGVSPDRVVAHAVALYEEDAAAGDAFDKVYCVFDRDKHTTFDGAVQTAKDLSAEGKPFVAIASNPCFEVWLLLALWLYRPTLPFGRQKVRWRSGRSGFENQARFCHLRQRTKRDLWPIREKRGRYPLMRPLCRHEVRRRSSCE